MTAPDAMDAAFRDGLLASASGDTPSSEALERELARLGLATAAGAAVIGAVSGAAAPVGAAKVTTVAAGFWSTATLTNIGVAVTIGIVGATGYSAYRESSPTPLSPANVPVAVPLALSSSRSLPSSPSSAPPLVTAAVIPPNAAATLMATPSPASSSSSAAASLADEVRLLDRARALSHTAPDRALTVLEEHAHTFPQGVLRDEAAVVRLEALLAAGRRAEAEQLAQPILRDRAKTPIARRMQDLLGSKTDPIP